MTQTLAPEEKRHEMSTEAWNGAAISRPPLEGSFGEAYEALDRRASISTEHGLLASATKQSLVALHHLLDGDRRSKEISVSLEMPVERLERQHTFAAKSCDEALRKAYALSQGTYDSQEEVRFYSEILGQLSDVKKLLERGEASAAEITMTRLQGMITIDTCTEPQK